MQALAHQAACLPGTLTEYLLGCEGGFVVIDNSDSRYEPGRVVVRRQALLNVAFVSVSDLAAHNDRPLHVLGHLIDHHLGNPSPQGPWLSDLPGPARDSDEGSAAQDRIGAESDRLSGRSAVAVAYGSRADAGARLRRLFELGYGVDETARSSCRDYFAQSLAWYCRDRAALNVADPQVCNWFRNTLWSLSFWRRVESGRE